MFDVCFGSRFSIFCTSFPSVYNDYLQGFMWGTNDPDLYIRWFQLGALSPILRLHSTKDEFEEKLPWKYGRWEGVGSRSAR